MASAEVAKWREWKNEHPDFPLTVAPCGQWQKKVRGRTHYFGPLRDPDAALARWNQDKDYLMAGQRPPALALGTTVEELLDKFLDRCDRRIEMGEMTVRGRRTYGQLRDIFRSAGVHRVSARQMGPEEFASLRRAIADGRCLKTQLNYITAVRTIFKWAVKNEYVETVRYGADFESPPASKLEAERDGKCRFIAQGVILDALSAANQRLRVAILLGINCAFGPSDMVAITLDHLNLDADIPYHEFRRTKNARKRTAVLWPETVKAIRRYIDGDRKPKIEDERRLLLSRGTVFGKWGDIAMADEFKSVLKKLGHSQGGVGLGSLRHTYATVVDRHPDQSMIDLTMGHAGQGLRRRVYKQLNLEELERLQAIAKVAHDWLFVPSVSVS
jgi:integrase